ncbi:SHIRT domain-containing protein [Collinsella sp. AGMB00827]|uniref:SHIRT domain-containing protein n=1 Tax=Collinsella ureilytica TaxID=2869515 RepID=A0ABS7MJL5_9ACTN|nr:SHIRT domain-containing protein [Collinsella urealyticum]MBY4797477.1 SHIRT domain-containing protein [Collinsella urealyticum]
MKPTSRVSQLFLALVLAVGCLMPTSAFAAGVMASAPAPQDPKGGINATDVVVYGPTSPATKDAANAEAFGPMQPKSYTTEIHYLANGKQAWQPYRATVGAIDDPRVNTRVTLPELVGFQPPQSGQPDQITWQFVHDNDGNVLDRVYESKPVSIRVVHTFQKLTNPNVFEDRGQRRETKQGGRVGETLTVKPLDASEREGFEPERRSLWTKLPSSVSADYKIELHYLRCSYVVRYDSAGGTDVRAKRLYFEQAIPPVDNPTQEGGEFLGWKADCDLKKQDGSTLTSGSLISKDDFAKIEMPAHDVCFTAQWKFKEKADYTVLFWAERADYDDSNADLPLRDRYDYVGLKTIKDAQTNSAPNPAETDTEGIFFPDIAEDLGHTPSKDELKKFFRVNTERTKEANKGKNGTQKVVRANGTTTYNVYYDRATYELVFEKHKRTSSTFNPTIEVGGVVYDATKNPYTVRARYGQDLAAKWPWDRLVTNWPDKKSGQGWMANGNSKLTYLDSPPYRLTWQEFIQYKDGMRTSTSRPGVQLADDQISLGIQCYYATGNQPVHVDFEKEGFDGSFAVDTTLYYWKSDTKTTTYPFPAPELKGFTRVNPEQKQSVFTSTRFTSRQQQEVPNTLEELNVGRPDDKKIEFVPKMAGSSYRENGYVRFRYKRNSYHLYLNDDPKTPKEAKEFSNDRKKSVLYDRPLMQLNLDETVKPERPTSVPATYEFKGWALDAAGKNLIKDGRETMPNHDLTLYASWAPPEKTWTLTVDPNGGTYKGTSEVTKTGVQNGWLVSECSLTPMKPDGAGVGGGGTETASEHTPASAESNKGCSVEIPHREGYDFLGWELVLFKKDKEGKPAVGADGKPLEDGSYRKAYGVPPLYAFENPVVENVYLRAVWGNSNVARVTVRHVFYDLDGVKTDEHDDVVPEARVGSEISSLASWQGDEWILRQDIPDNGYFRTVTVEANPNADESVNQITFSYHPLSKRTYQVRYVDQKGRDLLEPETVTNLNRHYDAQNYKPIKGWRLVGTPQQALVFDLNKTGGFLGINGTGKKVVTFSYEDARVLARTNEQAVTPDGYHRVAWKAGEHGSFEEGVTARIYDVVDGLAFGKVPVPSNPTPAKGYVFEGWDVQAPSGDAEVNKDFTFVAQWAKLADVTYACKPAEGESRSLPEAVTSLQLPEKKAYKVDEVVEAPTTTYDPVAIDTGDDQGTWTFAGWDPKSLTVKDGSNVFTGRWTFTPKAKSVVNHTFTYQGVSGRTEPSENIKTQIEALKPADSAPTWVGTTVAAPATFTQTFLEEEGVKGTWAFAVWKPESLTVKDGSNTFEGVWAFTEREKVNVTYEFAYMNGDQTLTDKPAVITAEPPAATKVYVGDPIAQPTYNEAPTDTLNGVPGHWAFAGWNASADASAGTHKMVGTWNFIPNDKVAVSYVFVFNDETGATVDAPAGFVPRAPEASQTYKTLTVTAPENSYDNQTTERGTWKFEGWQPAEHANVQGDVRFTGLWKFTLFDKVLFPPKGGALSKDYGEKTTADEVLAKVTVPGYPADKKAPELSLADGAKLPDGKTSGTFVVPVDVRFPDGSTARVDVTITVGEPKLADVTYACKPAEGESRSLPEAVTSLQLPEKKAYKVDEVVEAPTTTYDPVAIDTGDDQGTWTFAGWDPKSLTVKDGSNVFTGRWTFTPKAKSVVNHTFTYQGVSGRTEPSENIKTQIEALKPADSAPTWVGTTVAAPATFTQTFLEEEGVKGTWAFAVWKPESLTVKDGSNTFEGVWAFTEREKVNVTYEFAYMNGDQTLTDKPAVITAEPPAATKVYVGDPIAQPTYNEAPTDTLNGVPGHWAFAGWNASADASAGTHKMVGTWNFIPNDKVAVSYVFVFNDETGATVDAPAGFVPRAPEASQTYKTLTVTAPENSYDNQTTERGTWKFEGWQPAEHANVQGDVRFTGLWKFTLFDKVLFPPKGGALSKDYGEKTTAEEVLAKVTVPGYPADKKAPKLSLADGAKLPDGKTSGTFVVPVDVRFPDGSTARVDVTITVGEPPAKPAQPTKTTKSMPGTPSAARTSAGKVLPATGDTARIVSIVAFVTGILALLTQAFMKREGKRRQ